MTAILPTLGAAIYLTIAFVLFFLGIVTYRQAGQVRVSRFAAWMILFAALGAFNAGIGVSIVTWTKSGIRSLETVGAPAGRPPAQRSFPRLST